MVQRAGTVILCGGKVVYREKRRPGPLAYVGTH